MRRGWPAGLCLRKWLCMASRGFSQRCYSLQCVVETQIWITKGRGHFHLFLHLQDVFQSRQEKILAVREQSCMQSGHRLTNSPFIQLRCFLASILTFKSGGLWDMGVCVTMVCCGANYMMYKIYHSVIYSVSYTLYVTVVLCDALVTSKGRVQTVIICRLRWCWPRVEKGVSVCLSLCLCAWQDEAKKSKRIQRIITFFTMFFISLNIHGFS